MVGMLDINIEHIDIRIFIVFVSLLFPYLYDVCERSEGEELGGEKFSLMLMNIIGQAGQVT